MFKCILPWLVLKVALLSFQNKNFIVLLSDQSAGAKIGTKSAAVINITNGELHARCILSVISFYIFVLLLTS